MFKRLKDYWKELKSGKPGSRFQEQYDKERKERRSGAGRVFRIAGGVILIPAGLFFLPAPGPGFLIIGLGALLIAREFRLAAQFLDQVELRARQARNRFRRRRKSAEA